MYDAVPVGSWLAFDFDATELADYPQALAMMGPAFHMREPAGFTAVPESYRSRGGSRTVR